MLDRAGLREQSSASLHVCAHAVTRDKVANLLLAYKGRSGGGTGRVAEELARAAAREALSPLLDTACARLGAVVRRAYDIAADQAQLQRGAR